MPLYAHPVKRRVIILAVTLVAFSFAHTCERLGWTEFLENRYYDLFYRLMGQQTTQCHTLIVALDDKTLLSEPDTPLVFWGPHFARAIEALRKSGAAVIGLDYLFAVSVESWLKRFDPANSHISRTYDIPMRRQLASGDVILAGGIFFDEAGAPHYLLPIADYLVVLPGQLSDVGLTNFFNDRDGVIRRFAPYVLQNQDRDANMTLGARLAARVKQLDFQAPVWESPRFIGFTGPPGSVPRLSMSRLLAPNAEKDSSIRDLVDHKVVIVAAEHSKGQDLNLTPYARPFLGWDGALMSGAEVHANIVESLLSDRWPSLMPDWAYTLTGILTLLLATWLFFQLDPIRGLMCGVGIIGAFGVCAFMLFRVGIVLPIAGIQVGMTLCYLGSLGLRLVGEERRRAELRRMFGRYVSDSVVEKLLQSGRNPDLGGEMVDVTVLFSDIRNFTTMSEKLTAQEVVGMLNAYFSRVCEPILEHGGTVDKFVGDAIMAVFGAPAPSRDHARQAIETAFAMRDMTVGFQDWMAAAFPGRELPLFQIGIGIYTGPVVVGNIGSLKRSEYTAIGDTVNVAARLESASKDLGWIIVAGEATAKAAGAGVTIGQKSSIPVKGRKKLVDVVQILSIETHDAIAQNAKGDSNP